MSDLCLTLLTPTAKMAFNLPIESLQVVTEMGEIEVLKGHAPLVTTLGIGLLRYREKGQSSFKKIAVFWGYLEVFENAVSILAEEAEQAEQIDIERAKKALKESTDSMKKGEDFQKHTIRAEKAKLRLALVEGDMKK